MMMMIGDPHWSNPTVQIPTYDYLYVDDPTALQVHSPVSYNNSSPDMISSSNLIYNNEELTANYFQYCCEDSSDDLDFDLPVDAFSCDEFRMYEFKVTKCTRASSHDWTKCPYAHPGEKARRRDPKRYNYSGTACPEFRKAGECKKGSACEYAHGVFECWLHPARYRTQPCKDGTHCRRRVCFFAHKPEQLRTRTEKSRTSSPREVSPPTASSPTNNSGSPPSTLVSPLRSMSLQLKESKPSMRGLYVTNKKKLSLRGMGMGMGMGMGLTLCPPAWDNIPFGSPQSPTRIMSLPSTPIFANWDEQEELGIMERVESGRELREKIYAKLEKENSLNRTGRIVSEAGSEPDIGWVSDLIM